MYERIEHDYTLYATISDSEYMSLSPEKKRKYRKVVEDTQSSSDYPSYGSGTSNASFENDPGPSLGWDSNLDSGGGSSFDSGNSFDFGGGDGGGGGATGEW